MNKQKKLKTEKELFTRLVCVTKGPSLLNTLKGSIV